MELVPKRCSAPTQDSRPWSNQNSKLMAFLTNSDSEDDEFDFEALLADLGDVENDPSFDSDDSISSNFSSDEHNMMVFYETKLRAYASKKRT
ncbi:Hypothetical protein NTJ_04589 [Nesidiocoris tenuis]|uniref:Uncharacterized protein n=1 Tax=Nesidiocoris tenuis TaxID=355587 RepID=A0ABN7AHP2_9HEMI|nr:Hypothetical protein NTJ_04589 [Nesidiocoris tenuis]